MNTLKTYLQLSITPYTYATTLCYVRYNQSVRNRNLQRRKKRQRSEKDFTIILCRGGGGRGRGIIRAAVVEQQNKKKAGRKVGDDHLPPIRELSSSLLSNAY